MKFVGTVKANTSSHSSNREQERYSVVFGETADSHKTHKYILWKRSRDFGDKLGVKKGEVHRCTGTEALYRPYDP